MQEEQEEEEQQDEAKVWRSKDFGRSPQQLQKAFARKLKAKARKRQQKKAQEAGQGQEDWYRNAR